MPRRSARQVAAAVPPHDPESTSVSIPEGPDTSTFNLRRNWKWAAFTQFFYIFYDLFAINDISVTDIESDLVHGTDIFIPRIMQRLLFTLTYDRKISLENWQNALRKQYDKRDPDANPLGAPLVTTAAHSRLSSVPHEQDAEEKVPGSMEVDEKPETDSPNDHPSESPQTEEPSSTKAEGEDDTHVTPTIDWSTLGMDQKLDAMHTLVEWQFQNPLRLRQIMKSDDEMATWRSEPVGYDKLQNAYWLIGGDRLWIQRAALKPPSKKRKRKDPPGKKGKSSARQKPAKRRKTQVTKDESSTKSAQAATSNGRSRAAKEQAKAKLDAQAKALAEFQRQQAVQSTSSRSTRSTRGNRAAPPPEPTKPSGTRTSSRLRNLQDDGWEQVPDGWLESNAKKSTAKASKPTKTGLESDYDESASELTELSDDEEQEEEREEEEDEEEEEEEEKSKPPTPEPPVDFVEWETLCVTLAEWEAFPQRFAEATHYTERAFYKYLTTALVPEVTAELKSIEQKRRMEEALTHRKRSSRLAVREHEKEAARLAAQKQAEEEAQNARARRHEARMQREQEERDRREKEREERRAAREARVAQRGVSMTKSEKEEDHLTADDEATVEPPKAVPHTNGKGKAKATSHRSKGKASGKRSPSNDDWELDCEVCGRHGKNLDDGVPMMSCGSCSRWQHIPCHDQLDHSQGRRKRDWNKFDFVCRRCLSKRYAQAVPAHPHPQQHPQQHPHHYQQQTQERAYSYPSHGHNWRSNGSYANHHPNHPTHPSHSHPNAYQAIGQTSSLRTPVYPSQSHHSNDNVNSGGQHQQGPGGGSLSFNHYQPQVGGYSADPSRAGQLQPYNPYTRTTNGSWAADAMKYQSYAQPQSSWNHGGYAPASLYTQQSSHPAAPSPVAGPAMPSATAQSSSPIPASHYDTNYQRGSAYSGSTPDSSHAHVAHASSHHPQQSSLPRDSYGLPQYAPYIQAQPVQTPAIPAQVGVQQPYSHTRGTYPPPQ